MEKFGLWLIFSDEQPITELISTGRYFQNKIERMKSRGYSEGKKYVHCFGGPVAPKCDLLQTKGS